MITRINWLLCLIIGHRWERFGCPSPEEDIQLFRCRRCWAMPMVKHNGMLPRFEKTDIKRRFQKKMPHL